MKKFNFLFLLLLSAALPAQAKEHSQSVQSSDSHISKKKLREIIECMYGEHNPCIADYVVVGVGTASSIMILNLTNDCKTSVIGLEWGQDLRDDPNLLFTANQNTAIRNSHYSENYNGSLFRSSTVQTLYGFGRAVGGSSPHATAARRGTQQYFDTLATIAGPQWSFSNVLPLMEALESYVSWQPSGPYTPIIEATRGNSGPMTIAQYPVNFFNPGSTQQAENLAFANTMFSTLPSQVPAPVLNPTDYNANGLSTYISQIAGSQNFFKANAGSLGFLRSLAGQDIMAQITDANGFGLNGRKLRVLTAAYVGKILFRDGNVAFGVEFVRDGKLQRVFAKKKVIVAGGTLRSPIVLEQSGIGDPAVLAKSNIPVLAANTNVGNHMLDQIYYNVAINVTDPALSLQCGGRFYLNTSPLTFNYPPFLIIPGAAFQAWISTPTLCFNFTNVTKQLTLAVASASEGSVHVATQNKAGQIQVSTTFVAPGSQDLFLGEIGMKYIKSCVDLMSGWSMAYPPASAFSGPATNLNPYLINSYLKADHEVGTCRIAASDATGVVDGNLHVFGFKNLMVADNSVIPLVVDANTQDLALVIGQMAYQIITGKPVIAGIPSCPPCARSK